MWSTSLIITIPKKGDLKKCENYRTIILICQASNILLRVISNRMNPQAEEIGSSWQQNWQDLGQNETPENIY